MRLSSSALFGIVVLAIAPSGVFAQESVQLESGARVRLTTASIPARQVMRIVSATDDAIVVRSERDAETRTLARTEITAMDVSTGQRRHTLRGAGIGALAGAAAGALAEYSTYEECEGICFFEPTSRGGAATAGAVVGGVAGLLVGTTIGFLLKSESWQRVQPNARIRIAPVPGRRGVSVAYAF
ncbi:MAG: hypothetical protein M3365_03990 [Gemmatimonadota bacterium]|nr:hypothetical protein [Gemmatimonadota bacterium]